MTTIVIMPGGFHPFHAGHAALYQSARRAFPDAEVYVAATNDTSTRPFPFPVKEKLAKLAGVEPGHFVQVTSPFQAKEITSQYNPAQDRLIFVRSEKDATKPPQPGGVKKDGSPSYLQSLETANKLEPFAKHAYMAYLPTVEFGPGMTSATEIRAEWPTLDEQGKLDRVMSLYPRTQGNAKLAATVVGLLDAAIGGEQGVAEAFDQPYRSKTEKSESGSFDVLAKLPDGTNLSIMFNHEGNDEWQVEFYRNNSQEVTGEGDAQRIFATVLNAIQKFITKHKPAHLTFAASKETDPTVYYEPGEPQPNPASRAKLYDRLVQRYAKAWGYRAFRADNGRIVMYELSRMSQGQQGVAEGFDKEAEAYKAHLLKTAPKVMDFLSKAVKGWRPSKEEMLGAIDTGYIVMKHTGDVKQAGKAMMDELNTLHRMSQGQQGVSEGAPIVVAQAPIDIRNPKKAQPVQRYMGDIVPPTKPPSTEKRGVKGRPGQRPMPQHDVDENQGWAATYEETGQMAGTGATGGMTASYQQRENQPVDEDYIEEKWSAKYKSSINCSDPKGFSQRAHCAGRKK
jgi:hypothetical protein